MSELASLLGRWHQWRRGFSHERKLRRIDYGADTDDAEEQLERLLMAAVDEEVARLPRAMQLALQHVARAECMGVEVMFTPQIAGPGLDDLCDRAMRELERRLRAAGVW